VLSRIPVHDAAHGYVRGRSPLTLAAQHAGRPMVVRLDLEGFFGHVTGERIAGLMRTAGYPPAVAAALAGLLVTSTPGGVLRAAPVATSESGWEPRRRLLDRLAGPHLPQGAPTSPAAANLLAHRLDRRLTGLAAAVGARYGRYADDLVFSGDATLPARGLVARASAIAAEEGFRVRPDKTRVLPSHHRQRITGLVVNVRPAASRREYDALRALLHNCARTGPDAQNRGAHPAFRDHLLGRISWVASGHPARGTRLRTLFDEIRW
jgi:RNA-directed DNA polymerase